MMEKPISLCYKFIVKFSEGIESYTCYVNALSGEVMAIKSNERHCHGGTATGNTVYYGTKTFVTQWTGSLGQYQLKDWCRNIVTEHLTWITPQGEALSDWNHDSDDKWTYGHYIEDVSVHWGLKKTYDFYEYAYSLQGIDGASTPVKAVADFVGGNALFSENENIIYIGGDRDGFDSYAALDIIGHEWTHGVDKYSAGLEYEKESGALDESFADIFGAMVEYYVEGKSTETYLQGDKAGTLRSLKDPNAYGQPSIYKDPNYWFDITGCIPSQNGNNFCGVHTNSGVQNHWFYLLGRRRVSSCRWSKI